MFSLLQVISPAVHAAEDNTAWVKGSIMSDYMVYYHQPAYLWCELTLEGLQSTSVVHETGIDNDPSALRHPLCISTFDNVPQPYI